MRVTVVATGLGAPAARKQAKPTAAASRCRRAPAPTTSRCVDRASTTSELDLPAVIRSGRAPRRVEAMAASGVDKYGHPGLPAQAGRLMRDYGQRGLQRWRRRARAAFRARLQRAAMVKLLLRQICRHRANTTMLKQRTLKSPIRATGVGLHSGVKVRARRCVRRSPTPASSSAASISTRRSISAPTPTRVGDTRLASCLERDGVRVATVEHLMSALAGLGIDNLYVDVDAAEVPIMDGSAGALRVPAAVGRHRGAERRRRDSSASRRRWRSRTATSGRASTLRRLQLGFLHRLQPPGVRPVRAARRASISPSIPMSGKWPAPAPSASCRMSRPCASRAWRWAAAWKTPS